MAVIMPGNLLDTVHFNSNVCAAIYTASAFDADHITAKYSYCLLDLVLHHYIII